MRLEDDRAKQDWRDIRRDMFRECAVCRGEGDWCREFCRSELFGQPLKRSAQNRQGQ